MKVCIAEKPSVAKEIAKIVGASVKKQGYFEGNGYQVTWTFGHLCGLKEPHDYTINWKRWDLNHLPMLPGTFGIKLIGDSGVQKQFEIIASLVGAERCSEVINCGDAGQEGELIQRWVLTKAGSAKPLKRLWISSLTEQAIKEGFSKLRQGNEFDSLYAAGAARAIGDWILGMNATRLYTLKYGAHKQVLSIGRVQTPTLALIVNRQHEIQNFKSETYWELKTNYREVLFTSNLGKIKSKSEGDQHAANVGKYPFKITSYQQKKGKEHAPKLFDLTSLQVEGNKKFGFSAEETLNKVQKLYEQKLVSYPRVDTTYLSDDIYPKVPSILVGLLRFQQFVEPLLKEKIRKTKRVFDNKKVSDHHAIIPTGVKAGTLPIDMQKIYDLIALRFIAAFYPDCTVSNTTVLGGLAKEYSESEKQVEFKAAGRQVVDPGWRVVYQETQKEGEDKQLLPAFQEGETGSHKPILQEKNTQPPKYFTEATLLRVMETAGKKVDDEELREAMKNNGIGRPSTRANVIETLFRRKYIQKTKKRIEATNTGMQLIGVIKNDILKSVELTGQWEKKLREIEKGEYAAADFKKEMFEMVTNLVHEVKFDTLSTRISSESEKVVAKEKKKSDKSVSCKKCSQGTIVKGASAFGCSNYKACSFRFPLEFEGKKLTLSQVKSIIEKGKSSLIKGFSVDGKKADGWILIDVDESIVSSNSGQSEFNLRLEIKAIAKPKCPKCKVGEIIGGKASWGCAEWKSGCDFVLPFAFAGHQLSGSNRDKLIAGKKTGIIKNIIPEGETEPQPGYLKLDGAYKIQFEKK